jgi:16S rRNA processing protein RimM
MKKDTRSRFLVLGRVRKPHGLKGELSITSYADSPLIFNVLKRVFLQRDNTPPKEFEIFKVREHGKFVLLRLKDLRDRDEAEKWRGAKILALREEVPKEEDEVFFEDIIGCKVYLPDGTYVGIVKDVKRYPQEIWEIEDIDENEILFPAIEEFVIKLDVDNEKIIIDPPAGLLEIYGFCES